jgi:hypothetical protein
VSNTDSFIDEVASEVRRDRLFALMRRYGWIAVLVVAVIVGGAAWNEWRKAQERASAEALGDSLLAALEADDAAARAAALQAVAAPNPEAQAVVDMLAASEMQQDDPAAAAAKLLAVSDDNAVALIYRQAALLKALGIAGNGMEAAERRERLDGLTLADGVIRVLAQEQLAYLDIAEGDTGAALERLQAISADAAATPGLRRRASQVIVALGGTPALPPGGAPEVVQDGAPEAAQGGTPEAAQDDALDGALDGAQGGTPEAPQDGQ